MNTYNNFQDKTLARMDDQKYVEIDADLGIRIYLAICIDRVGFPRCPVVWGGNATYGDWIETYFGNDLIPILYTKKHKETGEAKYYLINKLVFEED